MQLQSQIDCTANIINNTNTLAKDWIQGVACYACTNLSAQSPEVGSLNEATYAPLRLCYTLLHETKGPGKQSKW